MSWKTSLIVRSEALGLLINTLTAGEKYSRHHSKKFLQPSQMPAFKKPKKNLKFSLQFLNLHQVLNIFDRKDNLRASVFAKIIGSEKRVYLNV